MKSLNSDGRGIWVGGNNRKICELLERSSQTLFKDKGIVGAEGLGQGDSKMRIYQLICRRLTSALGDAYLFRIGRVRKLSSPIAVLYIEEKAEMPPEAVSAVPRAR